MDLNYLIVRNDNEKMLKKLLHLLKKILKFCSIECYWKKYWKVLKIRTYWTLLKKYWKILILIEPSIEKVLIIEHYWKINNTFSLLYCIVLTQTQMLRLPACWNPHINCCCWNSSTRKCKLFSIIFSAFKKLDRFLIKTFFIYNFSI